MKGFIRKGSLRCLSFAAACVMAVSGTGYTGSPVRVGAVPMGPDLLHWKQYDENWGYLHLGRSSYTMSGSGCAATALSFLLVHAGNFNDRNFNPGVFCRLMSQFGGFAGNGDILWGVVNSVAPGFRFVKTDRFENVPETYEARFQRIKEYYDKGYYLIIDVQNSGHWVAVDRIENDRIISFDSGGDRDTDVFRTYKWEETTCIKIFESKYTVSSPPDVEFNYTSGSYRIKEPLNIRKNPSSDSRWLGQLPEGAVVDVKGIAGEWGQIIYDNASAWICLAYADMTESLPDPDAPVILPSVSDTEKPEITTITTTVTTTEKPVTTTVTTTEKPVTTTVTETEKPVTTAAVTTEEPVTETETTESDDSDNIRFFQPGRYRTNDWLNYRKGPDVSEEKYGTFSPETELEVTEVLGNWGLTTFEGKECWICLDYADWFERLSDSNQLIPDEKPDAPEDSPVPETSVPGFPAVPDEIIGSAAANSAVIRPEPDEFGIIRGDVDRNGLINILDYIMLKSAFDGKSSSVLTDEADMNNDGAVTMQDFILMKILFLSANN